MRLHVILGLVDTPAGKKIEYQVRMAPAKQQYPAHRSIPTAGFRDSYGPPGNRNGEHRKVLSHYSTSKSLERFEASPLRSI